MFIGLGLAPWMGAAQGTGTSTERALYFTNDPGRAACLYPEEVRTGETTGRCYVMACAADGVNCACPIELPNGWKQPLSAEQCQQFGQLLRPLPPVEPVAATGKEKPKVPQPATQVEKDKDEERKLYTPGKRGPGERGARGSHTDHRRGRAPGA